jgi:hypothetical protein
MTRCRCLILLMTIWFSACNTNPLITNSPLPPLPPLPHALKGYELYSWPVDGEWHFTLVTGTNRLKTVEEITQGEDLVDEEGWVRIRAAGLDQLKPVLARLPAGEPVFWVGGWYLYFDELTLPPQEIITEVQAYCLDIGLVLMVNE